MAVAAQHAVRDYAQNVPAEMLCSAGRLIGSSLVAKACAR
jgi:hypothetical protein